MSGKVRKLLVGLAVVGSLGGISQSASAVASLPTSGVCGFAFTLQYPFAYLYGASPGTGYGLNFLGTINFGTSTISTNVLLQNPASPQATTESQANFSVPFTTAAGPIPGSYAITFTPSSNAWTMNLIPVNGGNTILLQAFSPVAGNQGAGIVGVCQI